MTPTERQRMYAATCRCSVKMRAWKFERTFLQMLATAMKGQHQ